MRKFFYILTAAVIISLTACTKPETPRPEPEDTTSKSYAGCMRSDYPDITISGISVNDKIIYDIKTAMSNSFASSVNSVNDASTSFYSGKFTLSEIWSYNILPVAAIYISPDESIIDIYIPERILDYDNIRYTFFKGEIQEKTDNIQSIKINKAEVILNYEPFKKDLCKYDIEITKSDGLVIRIVYSGESIHYEYCC